MPPILSLSFVGLVAILYSLLIFAVNYAQNRIERRTRLAVVVLRLALGGFLLLTGLFAIDGAFLDFSAHPPKIFVGIVIGFVAMMTVAFLPQMSHWLAKIPQSFILLAQSFQIIVEIQLYMLAQTALLPKLMTFEGRNFDILVGLSAPVLAHFVHRAKDPHRFDRLIVIWNVIGMLILTNIVVHGILSTPTAFQVFSLDKPNVAIGHFPYVWLPMFLVPYAFFLHVVSLRKVVQRI